MNDHWDRWKWLQIEAKQKHDPSAEDNVEFSSTAVGEQKGTIA